jgi:hypothetical protein
MISQDYSKKITVNATAKDAFININNVIGWWATNVKGSTKSLNDVFTVRFGKTFSTIQITEMITDKKILWSILDSSLPLFKDEKVWSGTKMLWEISNVNNATEIRMTHIGLTPDKECYEDCNKGWSFYIEESLKKLITEGKGLPGIGIFANISNHGRRYEGLLYFKNDPLPDYAENFFFVDVKETNGETVTQIFSAAKYNKETFKSHQLKGDYFMVIENSALYNNISAFDDISQIINSNQ